MCRLLCIEVANLEENDGREELVDRQERHIEIGVATKANRVAHDN